MKNKSYEWVQRIPSHYVGDDCIQIMIPYRRGKSISILNSDGMTYHYMPNSGLFINKYIEDDRKNEFPYSKIPSHNGICRLKKVKYVNQIFDFNRVYIGITNGVIREYYVKKEGNEALLAIKHMLPTNYNNKYLTRKQFEELVYLPNTKLFSICGGFYDKLNIYNEKYILKSVREKYGDNIYYDSIKVKLLDPTIFIYTSEDEIESIKEISINFVGKDKYKVEFCDFPITTYSLQHLRQLENENSIKTKEPKISLFLNRGVNKKDIKEAKDLAKSNPSNISNPFFLEMMKIREIIEECPTEEMKSLYTKKLTQIGKDYTETLINNYTQIKYNSDYEFEILNKFLSLLIDLESEVSKNNQISDYESSLLNDFRIATETTPELKLIQKGNKKSRK